MKIVSVVFPIMLMISNAIVANESSKIVHRNPFAQPVKSASSMQDLSECPLSTLTLTGTLQQEGGSLAVVSDAKNHLYFLKINDFIGLERAKIIDISPDKISVEWVVHGETLTQHLEI